MMLLLAAAAASGEDIHDIRGPLALPGLPAWLPWAAVALVAGLLLWAARRLWRRRKPPTLSPRERALQQLSAAGSDLDGQHPDLFAQRVSHALREYIEARFQLPATQRTSEEFLSELLARPERAPQLSAQRAELALVLERCDYAKFAGRSLHGEAMRALRAAALQFIEAAESAVPSRGVP